MRSEPRDFRRRQKKKGGTRALPSRKAVKPPASSAAPTPESVARRIRRLEIRTDRLVRTILGGEYRSVFKGRGMQFDEVREYQEGDDPRTIDWNVTARMDRLFVKKYVEERELTVILAVDISASLSFATAGEDLKRDLAAISSRCATAEASVADARQQAALATEVVLRVAHCGAATAEQGLEWGLSVLVHGAVIIAGRHEGFNAVCGGGALAAASR